MKTYFLTLFSVCFVYQLSISQDKFDDALTAASYAFAHSKKAHGANNVFHTQEYADKAIEAFQKAEDLTDECGCIDANETAYQAKSDMESALDQDTYERSRFFAKRAKDLGAKLLEQITICVTENKKEPQTNAETPLEPGAENTVVAALQTDLEEKRRQLEIEQKKLEQQIAIQKEKQAAFEKKREAELKEQTVIKDKAELALQKLETALKELNYVLNGDKEAFPTKLKTYVRSQNELQNESLDETKNFYVNRAKELTSTAMKQFAGSQKE